MPKRANPTLTDIESWVFDLDNTLYPASADLFGQIDRRMKRFIGDALELSPDDAFALQKRYYREHGTTLRGLMLNHRIEPDAFLDYVHDIDHSVLAPNPLLKAAIDALPGRKFIYTNGSARHAARVTDRLGLSTLFEGVFDIRASGYIPKPDPAAYAAFIAVHGIVPARAAMFEDSHRNLKPAAELGMLTVWVRHPENRDAAEDSGHCHYVTDDLVAWLRTAAAATRVSAQGAA